MTEHQQQILRLMQCGGFPVWLLPDVKIMVFEPHPPPWRPFKRTRWNRAAKRVLDWAGVQSRWSWLQFMWELA